MSGFPYPVPGEVASALDGATSVLVVAHERPDADSLGSLVAFALAEQRRGCRVLRVPQEIPPVLREALPGLGRVEVAAAPVDSAARFDLLVFFDGHRLSRLGRAREWAGRARTTVCIDHHPPGPEGSDFDVTWLVPSAPSTTMLVQSWLHAIGAEIDADQAGALFAGLMTDTGGFRHANTDADAFRAAAELVERGADAPGLAHLLLHRRSRASLALLARAIESTHYLLGGRFALVRLDRETLDRVGATDHDTEGLISYLLAVQGVRVAALVREETGGGLRVSLRARRGARVDGIARAFGGGGHHRAAAFPYEGDVDALERALIETVGRELDGRTPESP